MGPGASLDADVALLTERRFTAATAAAGDWYLGNILREDRLLQDALAKRGIRAVRRDWSQPEEDWSRYRCLVFRTTWDYFDRFAEFTAWLARVAPQVKLCNDAATVRWNMDKHYLADLAQRGVPVVPSRFVERGSRATLQDLCTETGWPEAVVKPCVSGAGRHTYRIHAGNGAQLEPLFQELLAVEAFLLQPFQESIVQQGEDTLVVIGGRYSHAVRKRAKPGEFRVQDDFGGTVHDYQPTLEQIELAERAVAACGQLPAYGRVDMVRGNDGRLAVMELELIEPELWLRQHPPAADALAEVLRDQLNTGG